MPKARQKTKTGHVDNGKMKFKVGPRKTRKGAHQMSTSDLVKALSDENLKRYRDNVRTVLNLRGVDVTAFVSVAE